MILIYLNNLTARSEYVFEFIFREQFGIVFKVTNDRNEFEQFEDLKINYSSHRLPSGFFIKNTGLLEDDSLKKVKVTIGEVQGIKVLFPSEDCDLGFDLFSATFYMLSRYEEYLPFTEDKYGRFRAEDSLAQQNDFLETPVIDAGIQLLGRSLNLPVAPEFAALLTYDIDVAYKFKGRSFERNLGSVVKDFLKFDFKNILERLEFFLKVKKDPWDIYSGLKETLAKNKMESLFFFLVGNRGEYDHNLDNNSPAMIGLIKDISHFTETGIHPSFASNKSRGKLVMEKERLEVIVGKRIRKSRQHYLKLEFPKTYIKLIEAGITEDYSMGFPDAAGFRAGTCHPFYFYDLKNEAITNLRIFPITCMEVTFINYEKLSPEKTLMKIRSLMQTVYNYRGTFISIWHNENLALSGKSKVWKNVHEQMIGEIKSYLKK